MEEILRTDNVSKEFPGVKAVDSVSFALMKGEILALVGENGAGKSTLSQILGGVYRPDEGQIVLGGEPVEFSSPNYAIQRGISMVFQELSLVGNLSVAENLFRQPAADWPHWEYPMGWLYNDTTAFLQRFELDLDPRQLVKYLPMGQQQILEVLKAISSNPKVLIMDEPTSALTESETAYLFTNIRKLQREGMSSIYITHKLSEVFQIADQVIVMRDGKYVSKKVIGEVTKFDSGQHDGWPGDPQPLRLFRQGEPRGIFPCRRHHTGQLLPGYHVRLEPRGNNWVRPGLIGAGRTQIGRSIFGVNFLILGTIFLDGKEVRSPTPLSSDQRRDCLPDRRSKRSGPLSWNVNP